MEAAFLSGVHAALTALGFLAVFVFPVFFGWALLKTAATILTIQVRKSRLGQWILHEEMEHRRTAAADARKALVDNLPETLRNMLPGIVGIIPGGGDGGEGAPPTPTAH